MKKVLVTGGQGYIGSVLIPFLLSKEIDIICYDLGLFKNCKITKDEISNNNAFDRFKTLYKDSRDINMHELENIDTVVHLSGISNDPLNSLPSRSVYDPTREYTLKLAAKCKSLGIKFIFAFSCSVYGAFYVNNILTEEAENNPSTGYSHNN